MSLRKAEHALGGAAQPYTHEAFEHALTSKVAKSLVDIINILIKSLLIKSREAEVHKAKEELVEKFSRLP